MTIDASMVQKSKHLNKKIIVVEDNYADMELTLIAFKESNTPYEIVTKRDGQDLLEYMETANLDEIAFILMDLNMPKVNGIEVLRKFQKDELYKNLPVIILSSSTHQVDVNTCYSLGANAYLKKPLDITAFSEMTKSLVNFWSNLNIQPQFGMVTG